MMAKYKIGLQIWLGWRLFTSHLTRIAKHSKTFASGEPEDKNNTLHMSDKHQVPNSINKEEKANVTPNHIVCLKEQFDMLRCHTATCIKCGPTFY